MLLKLLILSILFSLINAQSTYTDNIAVNIGIFSSDQGPFLATVSPFSFLPQSREQSLTYCAEHDALNTIDQQYEFCFGEVDSSLSRKDLSKADPEAAVLGAFVTAYSNHTQERLQSNSNTKFLTPSQQQTILDALEAFRQSQLNMIREHGAKEKRIQDGYALGVAAAKNILELRWNDGWNAIVSPPTHPVNVPAQWSLNGYGPSGTGAGAFEIYPQWSQRQPYIFNSQSEFQVVAPPHLNSTQYLQDLAETKSYGKCTSSNIPCSNRTPDTIAKSMFWQGGGLEHSNIVLQKLAIQMDLSLHQTVQAYAASALAGDHAMVNNVYNKAIHNFWRPFHAIRNTYNADYGYYPGLAALYDPNWKSNDIPASPAGFTPSNQEYPCGHCEITSAMTQAISLALGVDTFSSPITVTYANPSPQPPAQPQTFTSFSDMQGQVNNGRIFLGVHLRATAIAGQNIGKGIGGKAASWVRRVAA